MKKLLITSAAVATLFATPAFALDVENKDGKDYYVYITRGESIETVAVASGKSVKGICGMVCTVSLEGEDREMAVYSGNKAEIKDGKLVITK